MVLGIYGSDLHPVLPLQPQPASTMNYREDEDDVAAQEDKAEHTKRNAHLCY